MSLLSFTELVEVGVISVILIHTEQNGFVVVCLQWQVCFYFFICLGSRKSPRTKLKVSANFENLCSNRYNKTCYKLCMFCLIGITYREDCHTSRSGWTQSMVWTLITRQNHRWVYCVKSSDRLETWFYGSRSRLGLVCQRSRSRGSKVSVSLETTLSRPQDLKKKKIENRNMKKGLGRR